MEYADLLARVPLFSLMDQEERQVLAKLVSTIVLEKDQPLFHMGDPGDCMYIVISGRVEVYVRDDAGQKIVLSEIGNGELCGELALFDGQGRSASALVTEAGEALVLDRKALLTFLSSRPEAGFDMLAILAKRLRAADTLLRGRVVRNSNAEIEEELSIFQRLANWIAIFSGSLTFLFLNIAIFAIWILLNLDIVPGIKSFDSYPFGFLTMCVSLEAIVLSICILLAQNVQATKDRIRGDVEYEVNLRAELEVAELHRKVDSMNQKLLERLSQIQK